MKNYFKCFFTGHNLRNVGSQRVYASDRVLFYEVFICDKCFKIKTKTVELTDDYSSMSKQFSKYIEDLSEIEGRNKLEHFGVGGFPVYPTMVDKSEERQEGRIDGKE